MSRSPRIRELTAGVELEVFVARGRCMAYSGRCLLSLATTGREANRERLRPALSLGVPGRSAPGRAGPRAGQ